MKTLLGGILTGLLIPWHKQAEGRKSDIGSHFNGFRPRSPDPMCLEVRVRAPTHFMADQNGSFSLDGARKAEL